MELNTDHLVQDADRALEKKIELVVIMSYFHVLFSISVIFNKGSLYESVHNTTSQNVF